MRRSVADPSADARTNVGGTINVLEAAREADAAVINVSTGGAIYGETDIVPTPETVEALPAAPYGQSKYCAERYIGLYGRLFGLRGATVRLANVYGPRQDPLGEAGVVAIFCGCLNDGKRPPVYGDGRQTRDYVYVGDVVSGLLALWECQSAHGEYNIGTGRESSVLDLIEALSPHAEQQLRAGLRRRARRRDRPQLPRRHPGSAGARLELTGRPGRGPGSHRSLGAGPPGRGRRGRLKAGRRERTSDRVLPNRPIGAAR